MPDESEYTLHRKRPDAEEDVVIRRGSKAVVLEEFQRLPAAHKPQYSIMEGGMEWNYLETEAMLRDKE